MDPAHIRAVRNNNPLNIIRSKSQWQGMMPNSLMTREQAREDHFVVFTSPPYGFRAAGIILLHYEIGYHLVTIPQIIARWAPEKDHNDTAAYIARVEYETGFPADKIIDLTKVTEEFAPVMKAMSTVEVGTWAFKWGDCVDGATRAIRAVHP